MQSRDEIEADLNRKRLSKTFPEELAESDPQNYWIDPKDGQCKKRGEKQFFINEHGAAIPVTEKEYTKRKNYHYKNTYVLKETDVNKSNISIGQMGHNYNEGI